jgi:hypothetical protein
LKKIIDVQNGVTRIAHDDGEGGLIIQSVTEMSDFVEYTKTKYAENSTGKGWGDNPVDARNHIATLPTEIINDLNTKGLMRGYHIIDPKGLKKWLNDPENRVFRTRGGIV